MRGTGVSSLQDLSRRTASHILLLAVPMLEEVCRSSGQACLHGHPPHAVESGQGLHVWLCRLPCAARIEQATFSSPLLEHPLSYWGPPAAPPSSSVFGVWLHLLSPFLPLSLSSETLLYMRNSMSSL
jgi:hypothetical protein